MPKAPAVYAVARGHQVGIFDSWAGGALGATNGFSGAKFKSFKTLGEAQAYLTANGVAPGARRPAATAAALGSVVDLTADEPAGQVSKYFSPKAPVGAATWFATQAQGGAAAAASPAQAQAQAQAQGGAAAAANDPDDFYDDLFAGVDVDDIVRRHSQDCTSDRKRPRPPSPAAAAGLQGCVLHAHPEAYCYACQNSSDSSKRRRHTAPAAPQPLYAAAAAAAPRQRPRQPFHADDAEVARRWSDVPESIRSKLMAHQTEGVRFILRCAGRCLLADGMGLGKTAQAIAMAAAYREEWPILLVVPAGLRNHWIDELRQWLPQSWLNATAPPNPHRRKKRKKAGVEGIPPAVHLVESAIELPSTVDDLAPITIISYDLLPKIQALPQPRLIICDESHNMKNMEAARTKTMLPLLLNAKRVLLMSGTPALSRPAELFPQIHAVRPQVFPDWKQFVERYCGGHQDRWGNASGCSNEAELQQLLGDTLMIRRDKDTVLKNTLPPKRRKVHNLDLAELPRETMEDLQSQLGELKQVEARIQAAGVNAPETLYNAQQAALSKCRQITADAKEEGVLQFVRQKLRDEPDSKVLLFAHHKSMHMAFERALREDRTGFVLITGEVAANSRQEAVRRFTRDDSLRVALLSIKAAGVGLNLTAANHCVFAELAWTPGELIQCEDRTHRIGQRKDVLVTYILAPNSIDQRIWGSVEKKLGVVGATVGTSDSNMALSRAGDLDLPAAAQGPVHVVAAAASVTATHAAATASAADSPVPQPQRAVVHNHAAAASPPVAAAPSSPPATACAAVRWTWAAEGGAKEYKKAIAQQLEDAWQALQRDDPSAQGDARHVDIGGGWHADLVRLRQVVTAQPHRTRRISRVPL